MAINWGKGLSSAASGAGAGASFGWPGAAIGGGVGFLSSLFGGNDEKDPMEEANKWYSQIPGQLHQGYDPAIQAGGRALPQIESQYGQLMQDPNSIISRLGAGYTKSPGYDFRMGEAQRGIMNQMAAGGMQGTPEAQQLAGQKAQQLAGEDYDSYMNRIMGMYGTGLSGMGSLAQGGLNAGTSLADQLATLLGHQGTMAYQGALNENQQGRDQQGNMFSGLGMAGQLLGQQGQQNRQNEMQQQYLKILAGLGGK